jgi:DNA-binding beta-propeller fold protein YncE
MITDGAIAVTPDGKTLLSSSYNSPNLFVFTTSDMSSIVQLNLGANLGQYIAITPDGTRAYIERNVLFVNSELIMVPLQ